MAKLSSCSMRTDAPSAKQFADFVDDQRLVCLVVVFNGDPEVLDLWMKLAKGSEGKVGGVVLRVAAAAKGLRLHVEARQ